MTARSTTPGRRPKRPIIVVGGGTFGLATRDGVLEDRWLAPAGAIPGRDRPRVCFIGTAGGDDSTFIDRFLGMFAAAADTSHLALFEGTVDDVESFLIGHGAVVRSANGIDEAILPVRVLASSHP